MYDYEALQRMKSYEAARLSNLMCAVTLNWRYGYVMEHVTQGFRGDPYLRYVLGRVILITVWKCGSNDVYLMLSKMPFIKVWWES